MFFNCEDILTDENKCRKCGTYQDGADVTIKNEHIEAGAIE